jgi:hypothetical protein
MTDAEIAGYMNWRGPGAYTAAQLARVRRIVEEVQRRETEACASVCDEVDKESRSQWPKRLATMIRARVRA